MSQDCWICGDHSDRWRNPEARLCSNCWGAPLDRLRERGYEIAIDKGAKGSTIEVRAPASHAPTIKLVFGAESVGTTLKKIFKPELQLGLKQIDDQVYFEYADPDDLRRLRSFHVSGLLRELSQVAMVEVEDGRAVAVLPPGDANLDETAALCASLLYSLRETQ